MKVLQVNAVFGEGSTGNIVESIHNMLCEEGHESYIAWAIKRKNGLLGGNFFRIGNTFDHKIHALLRRIDCGQGFHSFLSTKSFISYIKKIKPDIIHLHNVHSNYLYFPLLVKFCKKNDVPIVLTLHDCWFFTGQCMHYQKYNCDKWEKDCSNCPAVKSFFHKRVKRLFEKKRLAYLDNERLYVVGVSKWITEDAHKSKLLRNVADFRCIYNWVDLETWKSNIVREEMCKRYGLETKKKIILGVSQGWTKSGLKGGGFFCEFAKKYNDNVEIILVGENIDLPRIPGLHCIGFLNNKQELADLYSVSDLYVTASRQESFGLTVIEAMACGTPVVAYDNTSLRELIDNDCGLLVDDGDANALEQGVIDVLNMGKEKFSEICRRKVEQKYEKKIQIKKYLDFYMEIEK